MLPGILIAAAAARLAAAGFPSGKVDARLLLAHAMGVDVTQLAIARKVTPAQAAHFHELVGRRADGVPVQHLTGVAYFRHETLQVGPGVLVPRPETEGLVQLVIDWIGRGDVNQPLMIDLGTGSGAIALALSHEIAGYVAAVEQSQTAFEYAKRNLEGNVELRLGDWCDAFCDLDGTVDVVVANPPYIPSGCVLPSDVADHDPAEALFAGVDGLAALRSIVPVAARLLRPGGLLACEHDDTQWQSAPAVIEASGAFTQVTDHRDLAGRPRYVTAERATDQR